MNVLHALFGSRFDEQFQQIHFLIRKSAHFCSYGFLGALAFFSWRATLPARPRWTFRWSILALLLAVTAAGLDEFHQSFVPSRTSSFHDVMIDTVGAFFFQLAIALWLLKVTVSSYWLTVIGERNRTFGRPPAYAPLVRALVNRIGWRVA